MPAQRISNSSARLPAKIRCVWASTNPGMTTRPPASITSVSAVALGSISERTPTAAMRPSRTSIAPSLRIESSRNSVPMRGRAGPASVTSCPQFVISRDANLVMHPFQKAGGKRQQTGSGCKGGNVIAVARGVDLDQVHYPHFGMCTEQISGAPDVERRQSAGPRACRGRSKGAIHHVEIEIDIDCVHFMRQLAQHSLYNGFHAPLCNLLDRNDGNAGVLCDSKICRGIGKRLNADLNDVLAGEAIGQQRAHWIAITQSAFERAQIKMRVDGEQSTLLQIIGHAAQRWTGDGIVSAQQNNSIRRPNCVPHRLHNGFLRDRKSVV